MGKDKNKVNKELTGVGNTAGQAYANLQSGPTPLESEMAPISQNFYNSYQAARDQQTADYGNIMQGYRDFSGNLGGPTKFGYQNVGAQNVSVDGSPTKFTYQNVASERPAELGESYGYLREAMPGYREFAQTGGYSPTDIQELRARGVSPIRSAYSNTMMELNRARALGGAGGSPNYIAAVSRAQREMPGQMADAMTGVNAQLAEAIRSGRLAGLAGISGTGATMGGLSSAEANRMLQAAIANQEADLRAQGMSEQSIQALRGDILRAAMANQGANLQASLANQGADLQAQNYSEQSLQNMRQAQLASLGGQTGLYGTTPAMAATFGNQALNAYSQRGQLDQQRNQYGLGLLGVQGNAYGNQTPSEPWWKQLLGTAGSVAPYVNQARGGNQAQQYSTFGQNTQQNPQSYPYVGNNYWNSVGGADYTNPGYNNMGFTGWADTPYDYGGIYSNWGMNGGGGGGYDPYGANYWGGDMGFTGWGTGG